MRTTFLSAAALATGVAMVSFNADAAPVEVIGPLLDLTDDGTIAPNFGNPVSFQGALWETGNPNQVSGTGVFKPFLRVQAKKNEDDEKEKGTEEGYNTDRKQEGPAGVGVQFDEKAGGAWTRSVELSSLKIVDGFYRFALDLDEDKGNGADKGANEQIDAKLSLLGFQLFSSNDSNINGSTYDPATGAWSTPGGVTLHYNLDKTGNNRVDLDYRVVGKGNGRPDLIVSVDANLFENAQKYLVLYSRFGEENCREVPVEDDKPKEPKDKEDKIKVTVNTPIKTVTVCDGFRTDAGFEEWAAEEGNNPTTIPLPAAGWLLIAGLGGLGALRMRKRAA